MMQKMRWLGIVLLIGCSVSAHPFTSFWAAMVECCKRPHRKAVARPLCIVTEEKVRFALQKFKKTLPQSVEFLKKVELNKLQETHAFRLRSASELSVDQDLLNKSENELFSLFQSELLIKNETGSNNLKFKLSHCHQMSDPVSRMLQDQQVHAAVEAWLKSRMIN